MSTPDVMSLSVNSGGNEWSKRWTGRQMFKYIIAIGLLAITGRTLAQESGTTCFGGGRPAEIIAACSSLLGSDPHHAQAYQARGNAWYQLGQYDRAIADYTGSLAVDQGYVTAYYNRGLAWEAEGQLSNALRDYQTMANLNPSFTDAKAAAARLTKLLAQQPTNLAAYGAQSEEVLSMREEGGVFVVPVRFNDVITLEAVVDSGASDVSVPADIVSTLIRTNTLTVADFLGAQTYVLADGSKVPSQRFRIRSLRVGNRTVRDVIGSVTSVNGTILLGQSFLQKLKSWSVDNQKHALVLR